jgi:ligand-binding sensor domain-containing protein
MPILVTLGAVIDFYISLTSFYKPLTPAQDKDLYVYGNYCSMMKPVPVYALLIVVFCASCKGQNRPEVSTPVASAIEAPVTSQTRPHAITRTIVQDRKGNIWIAAFDGGFRYDGKSFTNITSTVSSARFFSVLADRKGNVWFGSIGSGVYRYDGTSFQHFTTRDGLPNNEIVSIYEDKAGTIWFGANGGVSRYDGKSFRNYVMDGNSMMEDKTGKTVPDLARPMNEVNAMVEDKTGKFWFATRGSTFVYDGRTFTPLIHNGKHFKNVRTIIEDTKGRIWLGGENGLWRYEGSILTNITLNFVGYIYEDKKGDIWTSSESAQRWLLSRYDEKTLSTERPLATDVNSSHKDGRGMVFGILEAFDGTIWFGALDGVYRYDGSTVIDAEGKDVGNSWNNQ